MKNFNFQYEDEPNSFLPQISTEDIIYFKDKNGFIFHIGVALKATTDAGICIYQSNGTENIATSVKPRGCNVYSIQDGRGPHQVPINNIIAWPGFSNYGILHLIPKKKVDPLVIGTWKYLKEKSTITAGKTLIPVKSVDINNFTITFDENNNFQVNGDDTDNGTFTVYNKDTYIRFDGVEIYSRDPISAKIISLTSTQLIVNFTIPGNGYVQNSELILTRQP